jgi:hypothetical protein
MNNDATSLARRRKDSANLDGDDRLWRLYREIIAGVAMRDSSLDLTDDERVMWKQIEQSMRDKPAPEGTHYAFDVD